MSTMLHVMLRKYTGWICHHYLLCEVQEEATHGWGGRGVAKKQVMEAES